MTESLTLKWGTLKGWNFDEDGPAMARLSEYAEMGMSLGAATQHDSPEQVEKICEIIDALDAPTVTNSWEGTDMSKEEAKQYVRNYRR